MPENILIVGASGHGKVVLSTLLSAQKKVVGFLDDDDKKTRTEVLGYPVLGAINALSNYPHLSVILGIGNNVTRKHIATCYPTRLWETAVHDHAFVHLSVKIAEGSVVFAGAVIQPEVTLGKHSIINTGTTVDHDCVIGAYVHLAPGVHLAGNVTVEEGVFVGIGSVVIPGITLGAWSVIGAGSVVVNSVAAHSTVMGVPARERML